MIYEKRLLVLGGGTASGCLRLEKTDNSFRCYLTGSVKCDCVLVIKDEANFLCFGDFNLGSPYRFSLPGGVNIDNLVAAVGDLSGSLVMYGGFRRPMPWRGNLEDDVRLALRRLGIEKKSVRDINDFFLDIIPSDYDDTRVAEVNYYKSNLTADSEPEFADTLTPPSFDPPAPEPSSPAEKTAPEKSAASEPPPEPPASAPDEVAASVADETEPPLADAEYSAARAVPELNPVSFYESVKDQVERLFANNERYEALERLLPDSRWIKVNYNSTGKYYLVGVIGDPVRYLCYGVPGEYSPDPPPDLVGYCQWLALDPGDPAGKGFWIMYQDGVTGRSVL